MKKKTFIYEEAYQVKFNYKKHDGYWIYGKTKTVLVPIINTMKEKRNHSKAEKKILQEFPNAQIVTVTYI